MSICEQNSEVDGDRFREEYGDGYEVDPPLNHHYAFKVPISIYHHMCLCICEHSSGDAYGVDSLLNQHYPFKGPTSLYNHKCLCICKLNSGDRDGYGVDYPLSTTTSPLGANMPMSYQISVYL